MSYKFSTVLANKKNYGNSRNTSTIKYIVIHYTANNGDTAAGNGNYFKNNIVKSSAHYFVDEKNVLQSVPDNYAAYHCGALCYKHKYCRNSNSIGIELCSYKDNKGNYYFATETIDNAIELTKQLMKKYNISVDNVIRHYDVTGKICPAPFVNNNIAWTNFKAKLVSGAAPNTTSTNFILNQWGCKISDIERLAYVPMDGAKGETLTKAAGRVLWNNRAPDAICNAELYNMKNFKPSSGVVNQGKNENLTNTIGFAFVKNIIPKISYKNNLNAPDWIGSYPMLLNNGEIAFTSVPKGLEGKRARTAIAYNDTHFAMFWVEEKPGCTLEELALGIKARGFHTAMNLDGGGSTAGATPGWSYDQGRATRGKIGLWVKNGQGNKLKGQKKTASTMQHDSSKSKGTELTITANGGLNMRSYPSYGGVIELLPKNSTVMWYGYYTYHDDEKWLYVKSPSGKTGYIHNSYVKE